MMVMINDMVNHNKKVRAGLVFSAAKAFIFIINLI